MNDLLGQNDILSFAKKICQSVYVLNCPDHIINTLIKNNFFTIEDILRCPQKEIIKIPSLGPKKTNELKDALYEIGLDFKILKKFPKDELCAYCMAIKISESFKAKRALSKNTKTILAKNINKLGIFSIRTINALSSVGIKYAFEIFKYDELFYKKIRNMGNLSVEEVKKFSASLSISLPMKFSDEILFEIKRKIEFEKDIAKNNKGSSTLKGSKFISEEDAYEPIFYTDKFEAIDDYQNFANYLTNNLSEKICVSYYDTFLDFPVSSILKNKTVIDIFTNRVFTINNKDTLETLGTRNDVTRERIRQIEKQLVENLENIGINFKDFEKLRNNIKTKNIDKFNEENFLNFEHNGMNTVQKYELRKFRKKVLLEYMQNLLNDEDTLSEPRKKMCEKFFARFDGYENFFTMGEDKDVIHKPSDFIPTLYEIFIKKYKERPTANIAYNDDMFAEKRSRSHRVWIAHNISHRQSQWREGKLSEKEIKILKRLNISERTEKLHWTEERMRDLLRKIAICELNNAYACPSKNHLKKFGNKYDPKFKIHSFISAAENHQNNKKRLTWPMVAKKYGFDAVWIWSGVGHLGRIKLYNVEEAIRIEKK